MLLSTLDSAVRLWDVDAGKCVKTYRGHVNKGYCAFSTFFAMDGIGGHGEQHASIVSGSECGKVYVWGLQSRELDDSLAGHNDMVLAVDTHPSLPVIASGSCGKDPTVRLWRRKE